MRPIALGSATWNPWIKYTRLRIPVARRKAEPRICLEGFAKRRVQKARFLQAFQLLRGNLLLSTIMWRSQARRLFGCLACSAWGYFGEITRFLDLARENVEKGLGRRIGVGGYVD